MSAKCSGQSFYVAFCSKLGQDVQANFTIYTCVRKRCPPHAGTLLLTLNPCYVQIISHTRPHLNWKTYMPHATNRLSGAERKTPLWPDHARIILDIQLLVNCVCSPPVWIVGIAVNELWPCRGPGLMHACGQWTGITWCRVNYTYAWVCYEILDRKIWLPTELKIPHTSLHIRVQLLEYKCI